MVVAASSVTDIHTVAYSSAKDGKNSCQTSVGYKLFKRFLHLLYKNMKFCVKHHAEMPCKEITKNAQLSTDRR